MSKPNRKRRWILGGMATAGALVVGWGIMPVRQRLHPSRPLTVHQGAVALNGWITVQADGRIGLVMTQAEMGQGVHSSLPMLAAEELDVPLDRIELLPPPIDKIYANIAVMADLAPLHPEDDGAMHRGATWMFSKVARELGLMITGGSSSIKDGWHAVRHAAAVARAMLVTAAANEWGVAPSTCHTADGMVVHASGKSLSFGALAAKAATVSLDPDTITTKPSSAFKMIGQPMPRRDSLDKSTGRARFGIDSGPADALYGVVRMAPVIGATLVSFNDAAARAMPGVKNVVDYSSALKPMTGAGAGVVVLAEHFWQASQAAARIDIKWDDTAQAKLSSAALIEDMGKQLDQDRGFTYYQRGDLSAAGTPAKTVKAAYVAPYLAHAQMEPLNCTAQVKDGQVWLWAPTQIPSAAVAMAAGVAGVDAEQVHLHMTLIGGGFGRRLEVDDVAIAVAAAKASGGRPVKVIWPREEDMTHDVYRPATIARFAAGLDKDGNIQTWDCRAAGAAIAHQFNARNIGLPGVGPDKAAAEGLYDMFYEIPNQIVSHLAVDGPVPIGNWRGVGHSHTAFFLESFIDELAHAAGTDPVEYRRKLLGKHRHHLAVLNAAVARAGTPPAGRAHGVALHMSFGTIVAEVAEVSIENNAIRVHRVVCAVDCGVVVNPNIARQQAESAINFGLSAALFGEITIKDGRVEQNNFHQYRVLRMNEAPDIEVEFIRSERHPEGMGEPPLAPVAPAVANAVFKLTGKRLRSLPLKL